MRCRSASSKFCAPPITSISAAFILPIRTANTLEICYELPHTLELFSQGQADQDEALNVTRSGEPPPGSPLED